MKSIKVFDFIFLVLAAKHQRSFHFESSSEVSEGLLSRD